MSRSTDAGKLALWRERLERFSRGDLSVGSFCAREQVSVASFYYWREKLEASSQAGPHEPTDPQNLFRPVTVIPAAAIRIELPGGVRIEVGAEHLEVVRAVVQALAHPSDGRSAERAAAC